MKKKTLIIIPIVVVLLVFIGVYIYYNKEDAKTSLTVTEKKWVESNDTTMVDINVINDYPLYGLNGEGVFFSFLDDFEKNVGLEFNKIAYSKDTDLENDKTNSFRILNNEDKLNNNDLLIATDGYIAIGKKHTRINKISDFSNTTFGVFEDDVAEISYYLKQGTGLAFKSYKTIDELFNALDSDEVGMIIIPNIMYLNKTIENNTYYINYYFTEMNKKIVLTLGSDNTRLNNIIRKYFNKWKNDNYVDEYNDAYFNYYITENNVSSADSTDLVKKNYVYGYVENYPYEVEIDGKVSGIAGEYLNRMSRLTNISFTYKRYGSVAALRKAIEKGDVDIYFDYYNLADVNDDYKDTISTFIEKYVILGKRADNHVVNSFESLKDESIAMLDNTSLYNYFENNSRSDITTYKNNDELVKNANDKMLVVDKEVYNLYKNNTFKDYDVLYEDTMMNDYKFMVKNNNSTFYNLFNYIITTNSYYNYRNSGLADISRSIVERSSFMGLFLIILLIVSIPLIALAILYIYFKHKHKIKKVKKEDRHKYTDLLTSLKNRNYLNKKAPEWEQSHVYPQAIVMIDLNNVKYVNDNYGHEEGDKLIITAASTLVNTQLENSEIIRTDGNEFLVYLVGYSERQVDTYAKKIEKEMKNLPHDFGASVGYSMIEDDIKTLDDAINEATLEMMTKKQGLK